MSRLTGVEPASLVAAEQLRDWALEALPTFDLVWSEQLVRAMDAVAPAAVLADEG